MGAELCELVCLFVLRGLKIIFGAGNFGHYCDDGIAQLFWRQIREIRKKLILISNLLTSTKSLGLRITVESLLVITDFLDVDLNLNDILCMLYKNKSNIVYIKRNSNHPKNVIKQISNIINDWLNKRFITEEILKSKKQLRINNGKIRLQRKTSL